MKLSAQMEDYLEAIGNLSEESGFTRVKDIASTLNVKMASVVGALKSLKKNGFVKQEHYGYVKLTDRGSAVANSVIHRHQVLTNFLEKILGLDRKTASTDACKIEHAVSKETLNRLRAVAAFLENEAHNDLNWNKEFKKFLKKYGNQKLL